MRKGLCRGSGRRGYYNVLVRDPYIHSLSARGVKTYLVTVTSNIKVRAKNQDMAKKKVDRHLRKTKLNFDFSDEDIIEWKDNPNDSDILNAQDIDKPKIIMLSQEQWNDKFGNDYTNGTVGYATTRILDGKATIYVKDSGDNGRNELLKSHEETELQLYKYLLDYGVDNKIADEIAHNMNPVVVDGVDEFYPLDPNN